MAAFGREPRRRAIGRAGIHFDVPEIRDIGEQRHYLVRLGHGIPARSAAQLLHADAECNGTFVADGVAGDVQQFAHQAHSIFDRTAIGVGAVVVFRQQKLVRQIAHAGVDVNDIEPRLHRAPRAGRLPAKKLLDVGVIHGPRTQIPHETQVSRQPWHARRRQRRYSAGAVQRARTAMPELDSGQCAVPVDGVGHQCMGTDVLVVPQNGKRQRGIIRAGMHRHRAGAHHPPAAFRLGYAEAGAHLRQRIGHAAGVRHLIEAVRRGNGPDAHRLEQNIEARIARHGGSLDFRGCRIVRSVIDRSYSSNSCR